MGWDHSMTINIYKQPKIWRCLYRVPIHIDDTRFLYIQNNIGQGFGSILGKRNTKPIYGHVKRCTYQNLAMEVWNWKMINKYGKTKTWQTKFGLVKNASSRFVKHTQLGNAYKRNLGFEICETSYNYCQNFNMFLSTNTNT